MNAFVAMRIRESAVARIEPSELVPRFLAQVKCPPLSFTGQAVASNFLAARDQLALYCSLPLRGYPEYL